MRKEERFDILVYTAMNERHAVSELWCISMKRFIKAFDAYTFKVLAVVSNQESVAICNRYSFDTIMAENRPLGRKFNTGLEHALSIYSFDYVLIMGDDDILLDGAIKHYQYAIKSGIHYSGFGSIYFWSPILREALFFSYERSGTSQNKLIGCGRLISRKAIESAGWRQDIQITKHVTKYPILGKLSPGFTYKLSYQVANYLYEMKFGKLSTDRYFSLWENTQEKGLDHESEMELLLSGFMPFRLVNDSEVLMIDIKTNKNIWPIEKYYDHAFGVDEQALMSMLPKEELKYIETNLRA